MSELSDDELSAAILGVLALYDDTSRGPNPWTLQAALNVLRIRPHIDAAVAAVGGRINSCYRCPRVNAAVGGSSASRHLEGLAVDIHPVAFTPESGAFRLWHLANEGRLGSVDEVIWEPRWIHVQWHRAGERGEPQLSRIEMGKPKIILR